MRIVFMGTPEFAVPCLRQMLEEGRHLAGVFTQPDKPKGRGHRLAAPPVKELALLHGIPVYQPKSMRTAESAELLRSLTPDLVVVTAYGKILPQEILEIPPLGCINVHASLLPRYRGAGPIQWAVINGETRTGVTTQQMALGVDTGDMLLWKETAIGENETAGELHDRLSLLGAEVLSDTLKALEAGTLRPVPQKEEDATHAPMLSKELSRLDFTRPARELHHLIQGLSPWPCAEALLNGKRLKIYRSELVSMDEEHPLPPGTLTGGGELLVSAGQGLLRLTEVQYEGSRRMSGSDFLRGHPAPAGARLE